MGEPTEPPIRGLPGPKPGLNLRYAYALSIEQICLLLDVPENIQQHGIDSIEARHRLERDGPNTVRRFGGASIRTIFLRQISNSLTIVLIVVAGLSYGIHDYVEGAVITAVIVLNIVVGFVQDYRAEATIQALLNLTAPTANVLRDGRLQDIKATELVIGDVISLNVGRIPSLEIDMNHTLAKVN